MIGQQRLDPIEQLRAGEQIKERVEIAAGSMLTKALLLRKCAAATMHRGWLLL
jgi:hypothetical protein